MKRWFAVLLAAAMLLTLGGCGEAKVTGLERFQDESGAFVCPGLAWGMTVEEAEAAGGWTLDKAVIVSDEDVTYEVRDVSYGGEDWVLQLQFLHDGGLWCVSLLQTDDASSMGKLFDSMNDALTALYGEPDRAEYDAVRQRQSGGQLLCSEAGWEAEDAAVPSRLDLQLVRPEGREDASLGLVVMCLSGLENAE